MPGQPATISCGTNYPNFIRLQRVITELFSENLEWVGKASNWAKFTAVSSLGVIHRGHEADSMKLLEPYLPKENMDSTAGFVEGGSLYALGEYAIRFWIYIWFD